ncbi:MAG: fumarylacetoacetate hydrolase family protein [Bacteroidales bacterium]|nr:fumarylacetoacetate hydrolase family protein [Bacteroidales bacterium]
MKILCIGRNYSEHIRELGNETPEDIIFFLKPDTSLTKGNEDFYFPDFSSDIHYECEVVVKIDKTGKCIPVEYAKKYYSQIALGIDYTLRDIQSKYKEKGLPWTLAKGFDYSAPVSEFIMLNDLGKDIQNIDFTLKKNGQIVQQGNTAYMLHTVDEIISYISEFITLKTGDLIFTGTPKGVGPIQKGDILEAYLEGKPMLKQEIK